VLLPQPLGVSLKRFAGKRSLLLWMFFIVTLAAIYRALV
jgi:hypothetical protein